MEQVRRAYAAMAEAYVERFGTTAQAHPDDVALISRHLSVRHGAVLDVGCGPGHLTAHLRSQGADAIGVDLVPELVAHARSTHPDGRYVLGSMERLPVGDGSLAGVLAWYSLIHVRPDDLDRVLAELRRSMGPTGTLVVGFFPGDEVAPFAHAVVTAHAWPIDELSARLGRAGFAEVEREDRPGVPEPGRRPHAALVVVAG